MNTAVEILFIVLKSSLSIIITILSLIFIFISYTKSNFFLSFQNLHKFRKFPKSCNTKDYSQKFVIKLLDSIIFKHFLKLNDLKHNFNKNV